MRTLWLLPTLVLACSKPAPAPAPASAPAPAPASAPVPAPASAPVPAPASAPAPAPVPAPASSSATAAPALDPATVAPGTYRSASCGARTYARVVRLSAPNAIEMEDLVSPCPPGARCIWSGVVVRTGTYKVESGPSVGAPMRVVLRLTPGADARSQPPPEHLLWWSSRGELTESDELCRYVKAP